MSNMLLDFSFAAHLYRELSCCLEIVSHTDRSYQPEYQFTGEVSPQSFMVYSW
jgi:hypothetical protein